MQSVAQRGKLTMKNGYIVCPVCRHRTNQHVTPEMVAKHMELWCHRCKTVHLVNIENGQCYLDCPCR